MATFALKIVTPDGCAYEGEVARLVCRTITGDVAILARHSDYCTALGMGEAHIVLEDGSTRSAACIGGMLSVMDGRCSLVATTWEWADEIDAARAEKILSQKDIDNRELELAQARLKRALVRTSVAGR